MLSKIRIQNFKSINEITVDFSHSEGKAPAGYGESPELRFLDPTGKVAERKIPVLAIYGANASGKSNLIDCLFKAITIINSGLLPKYYSPNKLMDPVKKGTTIEIEFFLNAEKITYILEYSQDSIQKELLANSNGIIFEINNCEFKSYKQIESKVYGKKYFEEIYNTACLHKDDNGVFQVNTFLKSITSVLPGLNVNLTAVMDYFAKKILIGKENYLDPVFSSALSSVSKELNIKDGFNTILKLMQKLNIDITKIDYIKSNKVETKDSEDIVISYHKNVNGDDVAFDFFKEESDGTQVLFGLFGPVLRTLEVGGVLIIDEIDRSLHPLILLPLLKMFKDKAINKNNAQILFTLHTTEVLEDEDFRISEFLFINKSLKKGTFCQRLTDMENGKKIRNEINFRKRYLKGFYSGVPYPTL